MREILFRGKHQEKGWVYGDLTQLGEIRYITADMDFPNLVEKDTVGQYTGMTDKNGVKIFEGDIVTAEWGYPAKKHLCEVVYENDCAAFALYGVCEDDDGKDFNLDSECEVVGNIHDNPELLEGNQ